MSTKDKTRLIKSIEEASDKALIDQALSNADRLVHHSQCNQEDVTLKNISEVLYLYLEELSLRQS